MTTWHEANENMKNWIGIVTFAVCAGMFIIGILLLAGDLP
jgi:hypothetical protein